jgi:HAD superfamily hydrolase (TIGR01509 family)
VSLTLPAGTFGAYLFDCDGTIVDSMPLHYLSWCETLDEWECQLPEELFYAWGGRPTAEIIVELNAMQGKAMPVADVERIKEERYKALLPKLTAIADVVEYVEQGYGRLPMAVVSGGTHDSVSSSLTTLGLLDRFDVLVCAGDYAKAKPAPDAFLLAAQKLGVPAESCLVFEDTDMGIAAASAARMASVRVPPPWER